MVFEGTELKGWLATSAIEPQVPSELPPRLRLLSKRRPRPVLLFIYLSIVSKSALSN